MHAIMLGIMSKKTNISVTINPHTRYIITEDPPPVPIQHKSMAQSTTMVRDGEPAMERTTSASKQPSWANRLLGWWK